MLLGRSWGARFLRKRCSKLRLLNIVYRTKLNHHCRLPPKNENAIFILDRIPYRTATRSTLIFKRLPFFRLMAKDLPL